MASETREAGFRLNLVKDEPIIRDSRWEIHVTNVGDFGFSGRLLVRHRERGEYDEWPDAAESEPVTLRAYDLEYEVQFPTLGKALSAARSFLLKWGAGEVEWLEWDVDGQQYVVTQHTARDDMAPRGKWKDRPDPLAAYPSKAA